MADRSSNSELSSVIQGMSSPSPQAAPPRGPRIPIALAVPMMVLVAALGAWLVYHYAVGSDAAGVADVVELDAASMRQTGGFGGSVSRQRGAINVRGMDYHLRATRSGENVYRIYFDFTPDARRSWVTLEQWELHQVAQRAESIPKFARHIKLSAEQRSQLESLPADVELTAAEIEKLRPYLGDWDRATDDVVRRSSQAPLLEAAQTIAAARRADAKAALLRRVQEIPKILSAEQLALAENYIRPAGAAAVPAAAQAPSPSSP
jgi:hypothetical protein